MSSTLSLIRNDLGYFIPARPVIKVKTIDGSDTLLEFSGFDPRSADMIVVSGSAERAKQEIGTGTLVIEDSDQTLTKDHIQAARIEMAFGKTEDTLSNFLAWNSESMEVMRPQNFSMQYNLSGPGTKVNAAQLLLLVRKSTKTANNPDYGIGQIILDMIHKRKSTPLNEKDIDELWAVSADLVSLGGEISDDLNKIFYTVINEVFTTLYDFIERMAGITGAEWDVDYSTDFGDILSFQYPPALHSGIRVKSVDLASSHDNKKKTSYILGPFSIKYDSSSDAGVKTDLFTTTVIDSTVVTSQMSAPGFTSLTNKAIAQEFELDNGDRRIVDLAFIMSRLGTVSSPKNQVNCDLVLDDSANRPLGPVLATFKIPLDDIKTNPRTIFVNDVDVKIRFLQGTNKVWVRMFQRSSDGNSDPNTDELNTIRWHHNNDFTAAQSLYSATAAGGDYKTKEQLLWNASANGPRYTYSVFSKINRLLSIRNQTAAKRLGTKQMYIDTSQISTEPTEIFRYLTFLLQRMSKPRISTAPFKATIPTQFIFKPLQGVSFEDSLSNTFLDLQVQRARIAFDAKSSGEDTSIMGAYFQEITLGGSQNILTGDCSCS